MNGTSADGGAVLAVQGDKGTQCVARLEGKKLGLLKQDRLGEEGDGKCVRVPVALAITVVGDHPINGIHRNLHAIVNQHVREMPRVA